MITISNISEQEAEGGRAMRKSKTRRGLWAVGAATVAVAIGAAAFASTLADVTASGHDQSIVVTTGTGSMAAGSAVITIATSTFTTADVGVGITVVGAGTSGGNLVTTIANVTAGNTATLAVAASTEVTGAAFTLNRYSGATAPWGANGTLVSRLVQEMPGVCTHTATTGTCSIIATTGPLTLPGPQTKTIWGYGLSDGHATVPGPVIVARQGETLAITVTNHLPTLAGSQPATSLSIAGLAAPKVSNSNTTFTFTLDRPGTFMYEPGADTPTGNRQVAMGMGGVLIVRPSVNCSADVAGCAYHDPALASTDVFNDESLVVMNDLDPALLAAANPLAADVVDADPSIHLVNGKAFPDTDVINAVAGDKVLLRYANASTIDRTMGVLGAQQRVLGRDGRALGHSEKIVNAFLAPGQTADAIVDLPLVAYANQRFALVDQSKRLHLGGAAGTAGALTFINIWAGPGDPNQPTVKDLALVAADLADVTNAVVDGSGHLGFTFTAAAGTTAAQMFIDQVSNVVSSAAYTITLDTPTTGHGTIVALNQLANGPHVIWVRSSTNGTAWSPAAGVAFFIDRNGPVMHSTSLEAGVGGTYRGTGTVALGATVLTSADISFAPSDAGTNVVVAGAGEGGGDLVTSIAEVTNATTIELASAAAHGVSGAVVKLTGLPVVDKAATTTFYTTADTSLTGTFDVDQASGFSKLNDVACSATGGTPMSSDPLDAAPSQVQAFTGTLPAPLTERRNTLLVGASDALHHLTQKCQVVPFLSDMTPPVLKTGLVGDQANKALPATTDGANGYVGNPAWQDSVWVQVTLTDEVATSRFNSNIARVEGFLVNGAGQPVAGTTLADGTGFEFVPSDGVWDSATEMGYVLVPLSSIRTLAPGTYTVKVHALDEAGNWGALASGPTITYAPTVPLPGIVLTAAPARFPATPGTLTLTGLATGQQVAAITSSVGTVTVTPALPTVSADFTATIAGLASTVSPAVTLTVTDSAAHSSTLKLPGITMTSATRIAQNRLRATFVLSPVAAPGVQVACASSTSATNPPSNWSNGNLGTLTCQTGTNQPANRRLWLRVTDTTTGFTLYVVSSSQL